MATTRTKKRKKAVPPAVLLAFHIKAAGLPVPVAELMFAKPRRWRFDFAWPDAKLAAEAEGGTWSEDKKSRHTTGSGFAGDCEKYNTAVLLGWRVLRFPTDQINSGVAVTMIEEALKNAV